MLTKNTTRLLRLLILLSKTDARLTVNEISEKINIGDRTVEGLLRQLVACELIEGRRGPGGGYCLTNKARFITVGAALEIIHPCKITDDFFGAVQTKIINALSTMKFPKKE